MAKKLTFKDIAPNWLIVGPRGLHLQKTIQKDHVYVKGQRVEGKISESIRYNIYPDMKACRAARKDLRDQIKGLRTLVAFVNDYGIRFEDRHKKFETIFHEIGRDGIRDLAAGHRLLCMSGGISGNREGWFVDVKN